MGLGRSISSMSFGSGEREQLAHQFSGHVSGHSLGSAPALAKTGTPLSHADDCHSLTDLGPKS